MTGQERNLGHRLVLCPPRLRVISVLDTVVLVEHHHVETILLEDLEGLQGNLFGRLVRTIPTASTTRTRTVVNVDERLGTIKSLIVRLTITKGFLPK